MKADLDFYHNWKNKLQNIRLFENTFFSLMARLHWLSDIAFLTCLSQVTEIEMCCADQSGQDK